MLQSRYPCLLPSPRILSDRLYAIRLTIPPGGPQLDNYVGDDFMIAWDTAPPRVRVGVWPDRSRWSDEYALTTGCCGRQVP